MREALLSGIFSRLINSPAADFVLLLGGVDDGAATLRYWPDEAPQRVPYPYAVSFIVSDMDADAILTPISNFEWQMMIYSETLTAGNAMAKACKKLFADASIEYAPGCWFTNIYLSTYGPMRSHNEEPFQTTVTFSCSL